MTSEPDKHGQAVPLAALSSMSGTDTVIASDQILQSHLAELMRPTQELRSRLETICAPIIAAQARFDHIVAPARAIQEKIDAFMAPHGAFMAQMEQALAPIRAMQARAEQITSPFRQFGSQVAALAAPYQGIVESFRRSFDTPQMREWAERWSHENKVKEALDGAGWLPHPTIPDDLVLEAMERGGEQSVSDAVERYLQENWELASAEFMERFKRSGVDDETLATMDEALRCRGNDLHRATCRTVFPEIERVARLRMPSPDPTKMASLTEIREAIGELPVDALEFPGLSWMSVFEHVQEACYAKVSKNASEADFPLPNRHAVAHGRVSYSCPRDSMNSLVIADFMLTCIGAVVSNLGPEQPE